MGNISCKCICLTKYLSNTSNLLHIWSKLGKMCKRKSELAENLETNFVSNEISHKIECWNHKISLTLHSSHFPHTHCDVYNDLQAFWWKIKKYISPLLTLCYFFTHPMNNRSGTTSYGVLAVFAQNVPQNTFNFHRLMFKVDQQIVLQI